ncbi:ankyrin repeat domain-containing protein 7-like [Athene cunicularia]|uniref:ankyrin repeat domain-containing protein 7-like n=1 Tax=Athene cunicularia TaxID=194338 RepID=UPI000EF6A216|nr:ankyrin repeat domain-containing protein 7-like [Athene cunicularia]
MQRFITLLRSLRERLRPSSASAPCAPGAPELREEGRGGLYSAAASGDLTPQRRRWWRRRLRIKERDAKPQMPLHLACANNHADVRFLAGRERHLNPCDNFQKTPLTEAVEDPHKDCVAVLLEHGASPDLKGAGGNTALHLAVAIPSKPLAELLLEHKAHINAQNELGYTPLTLAITKHCEEMVEFLLQKGADVHVRDKDRRTPLMAAAAAGDMNVIQLLLRHGADLSHEDPSGHTAVYYARVSQHANIANQLEEYVHCERMGECSAGDREGPAALDTSCSGRTADLLLGTASLTGEGVLPAVGAEQEKDVDSSWDFEVPSLKEAVGPRSAHSLLGSFHSATASATRS